MPDDENVFHTPLTRREMLGRLAAIGFSAPALASLFANQTAEALGQKVNPIAQVMMEAAQQFLNLLGADLQRQAILPLGSDEYFNWHYIPSFVDSLPNAAQLGLHKRSGVCLKMMTPEQRLAAHALLRSALSVQGYLKATSIMHLEEVLREVEITLGRNVKEATAIRDSELYFFTIFGNPSKDAAWGWRIEGHHLSLHFALLGNRFLAAVPAFMGSNPAIVKHGTHAGSRILTAEEFLARELMKSLDARQAQQTIILATAPNDIVTKNNRRAELGSPAGLPLAKMGAAQRDLLMRLIQEYVGNFSAGLAEAQMQKIKADGVENLHFAWAGSQEPGKGHYYRIHSARLLIEYDNTQNDANHIHTVYRLPEQDFGGDVLRQHYEQSGHHK